MGQYYYPVNIDTMEYVYSHDYDNGLKLMEHSYIGNNFMEVVETLLAPGGRWHKCRLVWAGDYADPEKPEDITESDLKRWRDSIDEEYRAKYSDKYPNIYDIVETKLQPPHVKPKLNYIVNHTKKLFISKRKIKKDQAETGLRIHPLPLLTAEGCGRGGGDYHKEDDRVGTWARDVISMETKPPEGYTEMDGQFYE